MKIKTSKGFTLIELLIVIAIIAIIAAVVFVALDPLTRFQDSRDSQRISDITALLGAIKLDQVDNGGSYLSAITSATSGTVLMIGTGVTGCDGYNTYCDTNVTTTDACIDLTGLATENYISAIPISSDGAGTWVAGATGYTLEKGSGIVTIRACESENRSEILFAR